jgi:protein-S-isoprenylcysteine O-methyltransferase Ste14
MTEPVAVLVFVALTAIALAASAHAWRAKQTYGAFRFLAFECIALLVALNIGRWFQASTSIRQLISWALLLASSALALHGVHLLREVGGAQERLMEDTQLVVERGAYRYIRHPLYASLLLFSWAVFFKGADRTSAVLALAASLFLYATASYEERHNTERFGYEYTEYMGRTKMFIPHLF